MNPRLAIRLHRLAAVPRAYLPKREVKDTPKDCPNCDATMRAWRIVRARWVSAGIDKGEV